MASFKAKLRVLQELFAENHREALCPPPPSGARVIRASERSERSKRSEFFRIYGKNLSIRGSARPDPFTLFKGSVSPSNEYPLYFFLG